jgi:hypothetical protein
MSKGPGSPVLTDRSFGRSNPRDDPTEHPEHDDRPNGHDEDE